MYGQTKIYEHHFGGVLRKKSLTPVTITVFLFRGYIILERRGESPSQYRTTQALNILRN